MRTARSTSPQALRLLTLLPFFLIDRSTPPFFSICKTLSTVGLCWLLVLGSVSVEAAAEVTVSGALESMSHSEDLSSSTGGDVVERVDLRLKVDDLQPTPVVCGLLGARDASAMIALLTAHVPIPELRYLKRIRKPHTQEVEGMAEGPKVLAMIGPQSTIDDLDPNTWGKIKGLCITTLTCEVPGYAPNTKEQFDAWGKIWPMNFRPPTGGMKAIMNFSPDEVQVLQSNMEKAIQKGEEGQMKGFGACGAVIVDPDGNKEMASAYDEALSYPFCCPQPRGSLESGHPSPQGRYPLNHAAMCAIKQVAAAQREAESNPGTAAKRKCPGGQSASLPRWSAC